MSAEPERRRGSWRQLWLRGGGAVSGIRISAERLTEMRVADNALIPRFESGQPAWAAQAELVFRRYLACCYGATIQRTYLLLAVWLLLFAATWIIKVATHYQVAGQQVVGATGAQVDYDKDRTLDNHAKDRNRAYRLSLAGASIGAAILAVLAAAVWGNHLFQTARSVQRHNLVQACSAVGFAGYLSYGMLNIMLQVEDDVLDVLFREATWLAIVYTAILIQATSSGYHLLFLPSTLLQLVVLGVWFYCGFGMIAWCSGLVVLCVLSYQAWVAEQRERRQFLLAKVGGIYRNRYLLAAEPFYSSRSTTVTQATDLYTGTLVALKLTTDELSFEAECERRGMVAGLRERDIDESSTELPQSTSESVLPLLATYLPTLNKDAAQGSKSVLTRMLDRLGPRKFSASEPLDDEALADSLQESWVLVMPLAAGTLQDVIYKQDFAGKDLRRIRQSALEIARAVHHLHQNGIVHGDLKPFNVVSIDGRLQLIDLDAAVPTGNKLRPGKYTEAYMPPEYMREVMPLLNQVQVFRCSTSPARSELPTIVGSPTVDVWGFGVILYSLFTGLPLFQHSLVEGRMASNEQRMLLATWQQPSASQLSQVLPGCSVARRLAAVDLLCCCLQGDPEARFQSIDEVLAHPLFWEHEIELPELPAPDAYLDVIISYQSTQVSQMKRLRQALNVLGISTADGTEVPSGFDWRSYYFDRLESAKIFLPVLSSNYMASSACYEEACRAESVGLPALGYLVDASGWAAATAKQDAQSQARTATYKLYFTQIVPSCAVALQRHTSCESDNFFDCLVELLVQMIPFLGQDRRLQAVLLCASEDEQFAMQVSTALNQNRIPSCYGQDVKDSWSDAEVIIPILTDKFLFSKSCSNGLLWACRRDMAIVPVLCHYEAYKDAMNARPLTGYPWLPFLRSVLNRHNRVPPNQDFDKDPFALTALQEAIELHNLSNRSRNGLMLQRLPKYASVIGSGEVVKVPSDNRPFYGDSCASNNMKELMTALCSKSAKLVPHARPTAWFDEPITPPSWPAPPESLDVSTSDRMSRMSMMLERATELEEVLTLIFVHDNMDAAIRLEGEIYDHQPEAIATMVFEVGDPDWFNHCEEAQICLLLITREFLWSSWCEGQLTYAKGAANPLAAH